MRTGRVGALGALWSALRGQRRRAGMPLGEQLSALPRLVTATLVGRYSGLSRGRLAVMALAALYIVSPVDLVPESLFLAFGLADDAVVLAWLAGTVLAETEAFLGWEAGHSASAAGHRPRGERIVPGEVI